MAERYILPAAAIFAFLLATARAHTQSVTIDEADTIAVWILNAKPLHWTAASNNHILNSGLIRLFVEIFGLSHLTVRIPALLGAAVYIGAAYALVRRLGGGALQLAVFGCLVFNPMVFDYLVAARGYSMAAGFLLAAIAVRSCTLASLFLGLSFAANFSFAFADAGVLAGILTVAIRRAPFQKWRTIASCLWPGLLVTLLIPLWTVTTWQRGQLWYGAKSLAETGASLLEATLYKPNPNLAHPLMLRLLDAVDVWIVPAVGAAAMVRLGVFAWKRAKPHDVVLVCAVALSCALSLHLIAFHWFGLLLPRERTGLFFVPLIVLALGGLAGHPAGPVSRRALVSALSVLAVFHLFCLRLTYFKEWEWNAEVRQAYDAAAWYNHAEGIRIGTSSWMYVGALNFYRAASGKENFEPFADYKQDAREARLYVLNRRFDNMLLEKKRLRVVFRGARTDIVVAVEGGG